MIREKNIEERTSIMGTKFVVNLKQERLKLELNDALKDISEEAELIKLEDVSIPVVLKDKFKLS